MGNRRKRAAVQHRCPCGVMWMSVASVPRCPRCGHMPSVVAAWRERERKEEEARMFFCGVPENG